MCHQTSTTFRCGHQTYRTDICPTADASRKSKAYCATIITYPARERQDSCLDCWTKQMGLIKVSDMPKGKDDLPHCRNHQYYYPVHSSRELYSSFAPSGDAEKDAAVLKWTPQGQRYDPDHKKWTLQRSKMPAPSFWSKKHTSFAPPPAPKKKPAAPKAKPDVKGKK